MDQGASDVIAKIRLAIEELHCSVAKAVYHMEVEHERRTI